MCQIYSIAFNRKKVANKELLRSNRSAGSLWPSAVAMRVTGIIYLPALVLASLRKAPIFFYICEDSLKLIMRDYHKCY